MNTGDLMSQPAVSCTTNDSLNTAARLMWEHDCGALPVTDFQGRAVGMVTDRDICMGAYTQGKAPFSIRVGSVMARMALCCRADLPWQQLLRLMEENQVRRVPVVDANGHLLGIVSLSDVARRVGTEPQNGADRLVLRALLAISTPRSEPAHVSDTPAVNGGAGGDDSHPSLGTARAAWRRQTTMAQPLGLRGKDWL